MTGDLELRESTHDLVNAERRREVAGRIARRKARVRYNGVWYDRDLAICRRALVERQVAGHIRGGMVGAARTAGVSRSTLTLFFAGRNCSVRVTLSILRALDLEFAAVHTVVTREAADAGDREWAINA